ncbi:hypothetical protein ACFQT0_31460 [Hymenobacter humi]|uniref:Toprim domain-containing protein n=1 Tax=Hymenobacter humi TaxID=1411620 RepID=A0ABW2UEI2_9BACT
MLVLHSVTLAKQSLPLVAKAGGSLFYYGDNDQAGIDLQAFYQAHCRQHGAGFYAQNEGYRGYKDLNDSLCKKLPAKPLPARGQAPSPQAETAKWWLWVLFRGPRARTGSARFTPMPTRLRAKRPCWPCARLAGEAVLTRFCERVGSGRRFRFEQQGGGRAAGHWPLPGGRRRMPTPGRPAPACPPAIRASWGRA